MIEIKRFNIIKSHLIKDCWVIDDKLKQFKFPTLEGDKRGLIAYCKSLNELTDENEQLKQQNKFLRNQLNRVCIENETMGDKLKKIERDIVGEIE